MFMCTKCHEKEGLKGCPDHLKHSYEKCECCGKVDDCVDCEHYKGRAHPGG